MIKKEYHRMSKNILLAQSLGSRKRGRTRLNWRDKVDYARISRRKNWWMVARDRNE